MTLQDKSTWQIPPHNQVDTPLTHPNLSDILHFVGSNFDPPFLRQKKGQRQTPSMELNQNLIFQCSRERCNLIGNLIISALLWKKANPKGWQEYRQVVSEA